MRYDEIVSSLCGIAHPTNSPPMVRLLACLGLLLALLLSPALAVNGIVYNQADQAPIRGATVTLGKTIVLTDGDGHFQTPPDSVKIGVRAPGYRRTEIAVEPKSGSTVRVQLVPFQPKALYLSFYGIGSNTIRQAALQLIGQTELNALVIDVKGDRGMIPYASTLPLAREIGAQKLQTVKDMPFLIDGLKKRGIYLIARIVVFKDNQLATAQPDLAVKDSHGTLWRDNENLAWLDPMRQEVWRYNIDIAEEAAKMGFDEIQFDYVRFPDAEGLRFSQANTYVNRVNAVTGFLTEARKRLAPYNVFLAADIFGYVLWNLDDTAIGQQLERLGQPLDYICPMLYPSGFKWGIPNYRNPVENPYEIVFHSLQRAQVRSGLPGTRFRPWLQGFRDYAFDRRRFGAKEIRAQIDGARTAKANGWMLWNPHNQYTREGLQCEDTDCSPP